MRQCSCRGNKNKGKLSRLVCPGFWEEEASWVRLPTILELWILLASGGFGELAYEDGGPPLTHCSGL